MPIDKGEPTASDDEHTREYRRVLMAWKDEGLDRERLLTLIKEVFEEHD